MKLSIIVIGDELLIGQVTDTNSGYIARKAGLSGWQIQSVQTVSDDKPSIIKAVKQAFDEADAVITTGGLGPTKDDITKQAMLDIFGGQLRLDPDTAENVSKICRKRRIKVNDLTARQAMVPSSCTVIQNHVGTAPIMMFERRDGKVLVSMPGVPFELEEMFSADILPRLTRRFSDGNTIAHRAVLIHGIIESEIARRLSDYEDSMPAGYHIAYLPVPGYVRLRIDGTGNNKMEVNRTLDSVVDHIIKEFKKNILCTEDMPLASIALKLLKAKGYTVSAAESCTGGRISAAFTAIPGASDNFMGGVVAYSNQVKIDVLGVDAESIETYGAVSLPVVEQMAEGMASRVAHTDCAVATSGVAGPGGGTPEKPVGTICIAVKTPEGIAVDHFHFPGDRNRVIERVVNTALIKLILQLRKKKTSSK